MSESQSEPSASTSSPRVVAMYVYPRVQLLDVVGPLEVLQAASEQANRDKGGRPYRLRIVGPGRGHVRASSGLELGLDADYDDPLGPVDTLIVAGGFGTVEAARNPRLLASVKRVAQSARRIASVCTGAHVLGEAGLLEGRRVTTHWQFAEWLAEAHPQTIVEPDAIYVRDGRLWTSAGVTAGMDLALALIEEDLGRETALAVSRRMVFFLKRPGGQSQFSAQLAHQLANRDPLRDLQAEIIEHPSRDHTIESLASRAGFSPRHFSRVFASEVGCSPARFVEGARVEAARRILEESRRSIEEIASDVGFGSAETMRRAFLRRTGIGPAAYRERFTTNAGPAESRSDGSSNDARSGLERRFS